MSDVSKKLEQLKRETRTLLSRRGKLKASEIRADIDFLSREIAALIERSPELSPLFKSVSLRQDGAECPLELEPAELRDVTPTDTRIVALLENIEETLRDMDRKIDSRVEKLETRVAELERINALYEKALGIEPDKGGGDDEDDDEDDEDFEDECPREISDPDAWQNIVEQLDEIKDWILSRFYPQDDEEEQPSLCLGSTGSLSKTEDWALLVHDDTLGEEDEARAPSIAQALAEDKNNPERDIPLPDLLERHSLIDAILLLTRESLGLLRRGCSAPPRMTSVWTEFIHELLRDGIDSYVQAEPYDVPKYKICENAVIATAWALATLGTSKNQDTVTELLQNLERLNIRDIDASTFARLKDKGAPFVPLSFT